MSTRGKYKTKQYDQLREYLATKPGQHLTVYELHAHFAEIGVQMGMTTLYRQLDRMIEEGLVSKYVVDAKSPACFVYTDEEHPVTECAYHCRCEECGRLIHLECEEMEELGEHLQAHHGFRIDPKRTVLYGLCDACLNKGKEA